MTIFIKGPNQSKQLKVTITTYGSMEGNATIKYSNNSDNGNIIDNKGNISLNDNNSNIKVN